MKDFGAGADKARLDLLIELNVGSAKPVNRLLRISDQKQFARNRPGVPPVRGGGVVRR